ncbi:hypothetical protein JMUB3933_2167 [Leptotrichia wadei]|uniref:Predicted membrane protein YciQ-like C-terminal domain-containing protein n=1 Tax=Leptotrichia wadei TaxID=157687 RepID=A0A510KD32_9FUSO|nr:DUF2207 domain-containing protein [Leptotrichia wadei]BBM48641.1 hypothetical protein JMUB3933_2167 [Leptotrichia wadei]
MREITIIYIIAIIILLIYCIWTVKFWGKNFFKKDVIPKLKVPKSISAMGVGILNNSRTEKNFHIGIFSLVEKNFITAKKEKFFENMDFQSDILYKKNLEKSKSNYYRQDELFAEERWVLDSLSDSENGILSDYQSFGNREKLPKMDEKNIDRRKEIFREVLQVLIAFLVAFLINVILKGSSSSSSSGNYSRSSSNQKPLDSFFEKMFEIYKRTKKKFLGSFWSPEKLEEFIIYKKNSGFYIFYFGVILASIIMTSKDVKFGSTEGNFGLLILAVIIVFLLESLWLRILFLPIFSKYIPKILKIFIALVFLFSLYSFMLPNIAFIFGLRFYILIPLTFVILFFIYKKLIVRYTENGLLAMNEIESFRKYILNFEKLEVPTFSSEDELIENFQQMYIYAFALGIEKRFLNFLDVTLEKNNFAGRKEVIYEKLWISTVFCDKKLLGELKLNVMGR